MPFMYKISLWLFYTRMKNQLTFLHNYSSRELTKAQHILVVEGYMRILTDIVKLIAGFNEYKNDELINFNLLIKYVDSKLCAIKINYVTQLGK